MNLLILISSFPRYNGDSQGNFIGYEIGKRIKVKCSDVFVLAPHYPSAKKHETIDGINVHRFIYFLPAKFQILAYDGGIPEKLRISNLAKVQVPFFIISELVYTIRLLRQEQIDIIHSQWLVPQGLVGAICKKLLGVRHVATIHSSEMTLIKKVPMGRHLVEFIANNTDIIISVSSHRSEELLTYISPRISKLSEKKIKIIPPVGVDVADIYDEIELKNLKRKLRIKHNINSEFVILFVGRLIEVKGCEDLIRSMDYIVKDSICNACLLIVGSGPLEYKLKGFVNELGLDNYIRFEGTISHDFIWEYYSLSDVVAFPSIVDSSGYEEGLPIVLLEALSFGKSIVATKTRGVMEVIEDGYNGFLVPEKSPRELAYTIVKVLSDKNLVNIFSINGMKTAKERYSWDTIIKKHCAIYGSLTSTPERKL